MQELNQSKLGTREYWDEIYKREVETFRDCGDEGEVWFGLDSVERMVEWIQDNISKQDNIIELGCGNGHLLHELHDIGYSNLLGVDYSEYSIQLAKEIYNQLRFETMDILVDSRNEKYQLAVDKGTFDAISLGQKENGGTFKYVEKVHELLDKNGILLIASCNWTENELVARFQSRFTLFDNIQYPKFTFGGVEGQTLTCLAFQKI